MKKQDNLGDTLVPDTVIQQEFGICGMTLFRWSHDPRLDFPKAIKIRNRNYRRRSELNEFKERMFQRAVSGAA